MGIISHVAGFYAAIFVISLVWWNWWLSMAVSLLGLFLIVVFALMLDNINESKAEEKWVTEKVSKLEEEIGDLKTQLKSKEWASQ